MPDLAEIAAAGRTDVLPGHTLSPWGLKEIAELQREFAKNYIEDVGYSTAELPQGIADRFMRMALNDVKNGEFKFGRRLFTVHILFPDSIRFMAYLSLRVEEPKIARTEAESLVTPQNEYDVQRAVLDLNGYSLKKAPTPPATGQTSQSGGDQSTNTAASNADSNQTNLPASPSPSSTPS